MLAVPHLLRQAIPHFLENHRFFYRRKPPSHGIMALHFHGRGLIPCLNNRIRYLVVLVCWPMCEWVEENHIFTALRSLNFSGLFAFLGKYRLRFVLRGIIDIEAVPRYNDCTKTEAPYISGISTSMRYAIASSSLEQMT